MTRNGPSKPSSPGPCACPRNEQSSNGSAISRGTSIGSELLLASSRVDSIGLLSVVARAVPAPSGFHTSGVAAPEASGTRTLPPQPGHFLLWPAERALLFSRTPHRAQRKCIMVHLLGLGRGPR